MVYIFFADGTEEVEGITVVDLLRRAGIEVTTVSINEHVEVMGSHQIPIRMDKVFSEINIDDADMLVLPGGLPGTMNLLNHQGLKEAIIQMNQKGKLLAAICAAPIILGAAGVLEGKRATCYPGHETGLVGANVVEETVVKDGNIITSRGLGTAIEFSLELIRCLANEEKSNTIKNAILYNN